MSAPDGVQNERTALAWQRTALSLIAGSLIVARLTLGPLGAGALVNIVVALPLGTWALVESRRRYRRPALGRDGRAPAAVALGTAAIALTEVVAILVG
jgi:uncharacterized membrane protein YidH (DUF202 family)